MKASSWFPWSRIPSAGSRIAAFSLMLFFSLWVYRMFSVLGTLSLSCPDGAWPVVRFCLIAIILILGPGLFFSRVLRIDCGSLSLRLLLVVTMSMGFSVLFTWHLYFWGLYSRAVLVVGLLLMAIGGIYGIYRTSLVKRFRDLYVRCRALHPLDVLGITVGLLLFQGLFESGVGAPFMAWDAMVSWDKWAVDMSMRQGLGQYVMGGYPQFLPALHSIFYKISGTGGDVLPVEHLLLHGFVVIHVAVLMLSLWCIGRQLRIPGLLVFFVFVWNPEVFQSLVSGYADIPMVAMVVASFALAMAFCRGTWGATSGRSAEGWVLSLSCFSMAFIKGNGILWTFCVVVYMSVVLWKRRQKWVPFLTAALTGLYIVPFNGHQLWYSRHFELAERSPFLHAFTVVIAHTTAFTPGQEHFRSWVDRLMVGYQVPAPLGPWVIFGSIVLVMWALCQRRLFYLSLLGLLMMVLWFYTSSYDLRNAFVPLCLICMSMVAAPFDTRLGNSGKTLRYALCLGVVWAGLATNGGQREWALMQKPFHRFLLPPSFVLPSASRHMAIRPEGDIRNLLFDTPFGQRATHLNAGSILYRLLAPRGVYAINANSFQEVKRHDLLVRDWHMGLPSGFVPVSTLLTRRGQSLAMYMPVFYPVDAAVMAIGGPEDFVPIPDSILKANRRYSISVPVPPAAPGLSTQRDGILSLQIAPPDAELVLTLDPSDASRDPYSGYFEAIRDGDRLRLLYWMRDEGPAVPRILVTVGKQDVKLSAVEWGQ